MKYFYCHRCGKQLYPDTYNWTWTAERDTPVPTCSDDRACIRPSRQPLPVLRAQKRTDNVLEHVVSR